MQKAERLLDLAALLLRASEPVSWREIQEQFPDDYGGPGEAAIRKFERDKAELLELGIPVRWVGGDEDLSAGYLVDKEDFYLPDLKLRPEDLALLYVAGSAALAQRVFPQQPEAMAKFLEQEYRVAAQRFVVYGDARNVQVEHGGYDVDQAYDADCQLGRGVDAG